MSRPGAVLLVAALLVACDRGPARPAAIDRENDLCSACRMVIVDARTAAQVAVPGEDPRFFDDPVCLRRGLKAADPLPAEARVFLADFRTGEWATLDGAVFARIPAVDTPMASHWVAYADDPSRRLDPRAAGAEAIPAAAFLTAGDPEDER